MKIGLILPHIFAQEKLKNKTIFAPFTLAIDLANNLVKAGHEVTLYTPGPVNTKAKNITADLESINRVLKQENLEINELINHSPLAFVSLARQVETQLISTAYNAANRNEHDILHIFICENETSLYFADLLKTPTVFTHHDPYNFYRKYRASFPNLANLNYVSISDSQRETAPSNLNFIATVYNGIDPTQFKFIEQCGDYYAYLGRIVRNKGCHLAIQACKESVANLKIAGKHFKDSTDEAGNYWDKYILPHIDNNQIEYVGYLKPVEETSPFLGKAKALLFPIEWPEPFGMVMIEALACGTPVIAFDRGPTREVIQHGVNGFLVKNIEEMKKAMGKIDQIDRKKCRDTVLEKFTTKHMTEGYLKVYKSLVSKE